jgi:periplasmic protein TonB
LALRDTIQLEREPFGGPIAGSLLLHLFVVAGIAVATYLVGHIRGNEWGNNQAPGAIQATLVSSAPTIPLPREAPPTQNVLATEQPSQAPAIAEQKAVQAPQPDAIPIPLKQTQKKLPEKKQAPPPAPKHAQPQPLQHRAQFGEAPATQIPHSLAGNPGQNTPINVTGGGQGFNYPYYVGIIQRKVQQAWYLQEVDPRTAGGLQVRVIFSIARDGTPSNIRISHGSGSPSLDSSALRAVQRVESFGPLPPGYSGSNVSVEYTFSYDQPAH